MRHWQHLLACLGFVAIGVVLVAIGAEALAFIPVLCCAVMMGMMVWMMVQH